MKCSHELKTKKQLLEALMLHFYTCDTKLLQRKMNYYYPEGSIKKKADVLEFYLKVFYPED